MFVFHSLSRLITLVLSFLIIFHVSANPVPSSLTDLDLDGDSIDSIDSISVNPDSLVGAGGCQMDTSSSDSSDENTESDSNVVFRRQSRTPPTSCPNVNIQFPKIRPKRVRTPKWRPPDQLPKEDPPSTGNARDSEFCLHEYRLLVSCGGPEVWYGGRIGYVLNCLDGKFSLFIINRNYD